MLLALASMPAIVFYRAAEWCLRRRLRAPAYLVLAVLAVGTACGLLRLTGVIIFPSDHTWSVDFFNASWRDEGVGFLMIFGAPFSGVLAALLSRRKQDGGSSGAQIEEKT
jgi:hypothetical protein